MPPIRTTAASQYPLDIILCIIAKFQQFLGFTVRAAEPTMTWLENWVKIYQPGRRFAVEEYMSYTHVKPLLTIQEKKLFEKSFFTLCHHFFPEERDIRLLRPRDKFL